MKSFAAEPHSLRKPLAAAILIATTSALGSAKTHAADTHGPSIVFRFEPIMVNGRNAFHVIMSVRAWQPETKIIVPNHWDGATHLENQTHNLRIDSPGGQLEIQ